MMLRIITILLLIHHLKLPTDKWYLWLIGFIAVDVISEGIHRNKLKDVYEEVVRHGNMLESIDDKIEEPEIFDPKI